MKKWLVLFSLLSGSLQAQTPAATNPAPAEALSGQQVCYETEITNAGAPGFSPYIRLLLDPGLSFDSASSFGSGLTPVPPTPTQFPAAPGNQLQDPLTMTNVTGPENGTFVLLRPPVGSLVAGAPPIPIEICLTVDPAADIGIPLNVGIQPVFELGDSATGVNGPIEGSVVNSTITPTLLLIQKRSNAPETERPPGPSWAFQFALEVDIAQGQTVDNLVLSDTIPASLIYDGGLSITGGVGCTAVEPVLGASGGLLEVTCLSATGTAAASDVLVTFNVYVDDILSEAACDSQPIINPLSVDADFAGAAIPTQLADALTTTANAVVQKGAFPTDVNPGDGVSYTLDIQITDFANATAMLITDTLPSGMDLVDGSLSINGGAAITFTSPLGSSAASFVENGDGSTSIEIDLAALGITLTGGSAVQVTYDANVLSAFNFGGAGTVQAGDSLTNNADINFALDGGASNCTNDASSTLTVQPVLPSKTIVTAGPYQPGDAVTFRLSLSVPSGDTSAIVFTDFFPLPVFDATTLNTTLDLTTNPDITLAPTNTLAGITPTMIMTDPASNSLRIEWPDIATNAAQVLAVDVTITVEDEPFADGLPLTNLFQAQTNNSVGETTSGVDPTGFQVGAPVLTIDKSVISTSSGATPDADGNVTGVDAGDVVTFAVTLVNDGGAPAFDVTVTDPTPPGFSACVLDSVVGNAGPIATTGSLAAGLVLAGSIAETDGAAGGPDEVVVTLSCTLDAVAPNQVLTNTASATWASQPGATAFPPVTDDATAQVPGVAISKERLSISPSEAALGLGADAQENEVAIGSLVRYRVSVTLPEGVSNNIILRDQLDNGVAFANLNGLAGNFCIATLPATVSTTNTTLNATCSNVGTAAATNPRLFDVGGVPARRVQFDLDNITVSAPGSFSDQQTSATLVFEYTALILDAANNNDGNNRNNNAQWRQGTTVIASAQAPNVVIREPNFTVTKTFTPSAGDAGAATTVAIVVTAAGGNNNPNGFEVELTDMLDPNLVFAGNLATGTCATPPDGGTLLFDVPTQTVSAQWTTFTKGTSCEITFDVTVAPGVPIGSTINNTANLSASGLPGGGFGEANELTDQSPYVDDARDSERTQQLSGSANFLVAQVSQQKVVVDRSETVGSDQFDDPIPDVTIGEVVTYQITVTVPDGTATNVAVTDQAVTAPFKLELLSVDSVVIGADISQLGSPGTPPTPIITLSDSDVDGLDDRAVIAFGDIENATDTGTTLPADNQIQLTVTARVATVPANFASTTELRNNVLVSSDTFADVIASTDVEVVEPNLTVSKSGDINSGQAGDVVTFTLDVGQSGSSTADARAVVITDTLPSTFTSVSNLVFVGGGSCPSAVPTLEQISGNTVSIEFDELPLSEVCRFTYEATIDASVQLTSTIRNAVALSYASTDEAEANEQARLYSDNAEFDITISGPGIEKTFVSSADPNTPDSDGALGPEPDITIGESVTYRIRIAIPSGTLADATVVEQLPFPGGSPAAEFSLSSATLGVIPAGVTIGSGLTAGAGPSTASDSAPTDGVDDRFEFDLGDVVNSTGTTQFLEIDVVAVPANLPNNFDLDNVRNTASLEFSVNNVVQPILSDSADVDLVRPDLQIAKTPDMLPDQSSADTLTFTIEISHTTLSNAPAYDLAIVDTLPDPGSSSPTNVVASADCQGFGFTVPVPKTLSLTIDQLDNGGVCTITYDVTVDPTVVSGASYSNEASLTFDTTPDGSGDTLGPIADQGMFSIDRPDILKSVFFVDNPLLGTSTQGDLLTPDAAIGAEVCYHSTITFPEGITQSATFVDTLPSGSVNGAQGVMSITSATVFGAGLLGASNGFNDIVISDDLGGDAINDTATFSFGDITNPTADNAVTTADQLVLQVCARIVDLGPSIPADPDTNEAPDVLTNTAEFSFFDPGAGGTVSQTDTTNVEVIEPALNTSKSLVSVVDGLATIQIDLTNVGTGVGFDAIVTDTLDAADFDLATIMPVTTPSGFVFSVVGGDTVSFASDPNAAAPDNTLEPGETLAFVFSVMLADPLPDLTAPISNTAQASVTSMPDAPADDRLTSDSATVDLLFPLLDASKSDALLIDADTSTSVTGGDTLRYTIVVSNSGTAPANNIVVTDLIGDPNLSLVVGSVTTTLGTVVVGNTAGDTTVGVDVPSIVNAGSVTITFDAVIASPLPLGVTEVSNQATVASDEQSDIVTNDPDTVPDDDATVTPVARVADLQVTKTAQPSPAVPGNNLTFMVLVENLGPDPVDDLQFVDALPVEVLNPTWQCSPSTGATCTTAPQSVATGATINDGPNTLPVGGTLMYVVTGQIDPSVTADILNSASASSAGSTDPDPTNDDDSVVVPLTPLADLAVVKSTTSTSLNPGDPITYAVVVANNGPSDAVAVQLFDPTPAGTTFVTADAPCAAGFPCALGTIASGDSVTINVSYQVDDPYGGSGTVFNEASVSSGTTDPVPDNNSDDVTTPVGSSASADLSLVKSGPPSAAPGSTVTFAFDVTNAGPNDAQNVVIVDPIPTGLTFSSGMPACSQVGANVECQLGTVGVNETVSATIVFDVPGAYAGPDPIVNTASVTSDTSDPDLSDNDSSTSVPLGAASVDLSVVKTGPLTAVAGDTVVYTLIVSNAGPGDATGVVLSDPAPAGLTYNDAASDALCDPGGGGASCTIGNLAAGASVTLGIAFDVDNPYTGPAVILNVASVTGNEPEADPSDNSDSASTSTTGSAAADLSIVKDGPVVVGSDNSVTFTITVSNEGPGDATNVVVTDPIPTQLTYVDADSDARCDQVVNDIQCVLGNLVSGASTTLSVRLTALPSYTGPDPIVNIATVGSDTPDGNPANDSDDHEVDVPPPVLLADKAGELTDDNDNSGDITGGDVLTYTVEIANTGQFAATGVVFTDTPDSNTTLVESSVMTTQGVVTSGNVAGDLTVVVDIGQLDGQGAVTIVYQVTVNDRVPRSIRRLVNQGELTSDQLPPVLTNDPNTNDPSDATVLPLPAPLAIPVNNPLWLVLLVLLSGLIGARKLGQIPQRI